MDTARLRQIQELFLRTADIKPAEREAFLQTNCHNDTGLKADVLSLLSEAEDDSSLLDKDIAFVANKLLDDTAQDLRGRRELGPYRLKKVLGEGGMGTVFLAEREDLANFVAVKILRDAWLSPARCERFAHEQRMLAQLAHPSIARIYDAGVLEDGTPWFVMEYVDGLPITKHCLTLDYTVEKRLELFRSVCDAVQHAHEHAIIHRDLKPSNIFVTNEGCVRLLDFGIAKQLSGEALADRTETSLRLLTPGYASPEQARGEPAGTRDDVYSLGVVLYELLTGRLPFERTGGFERELQGTEPPSALAGGGRLSKAAWADLDVLCAVATHRDPQRRYGSAEAFKRDIDHYFKGEPLEARADSVSYRLRKFLRRRRQPLLTAAAVVLAVLVLVGFFTWRLTVARNTAMQQAARAERTQQFMTNLLAGGDAEGGPSQELRVTTLLDRGMQEARSLDKEPVVQADLYQTLGSMFQKLGSFSKADSLLFSALNLRKGLFGVDSAEAAKTMLAMSILKAKEANFTEAERLAREGLKMTQRHVPAGDAAVAQALSTLGMVLEYRGSYVEAVKVLSEAVRLQSLPGRATPDLAFSLGELANVRFYLGEFQAAEDLSRRTINMQRRLHGDRHPTIAENLSILAAIKYDAARYTEAETLSRQELEINQGWYGRNHPETASTLRSLGAALIGQKRYAEGKSLLDEALQIQEHANGPIHFHVALVLNDLGSLASDLNQPDKAEAYYRRSVDIYRKVYADHHFAIAVVIGNLSTLYLEGGQYRRAEIGFREMLDRLHKALPPDNFDIAVAEIKLGRSLLRQHLYLEALTHTTAGYESLIEKPDPSPLFKRSALKDLAAEYDALHQAAKARKFRAELAGMKTQTR